MMILAFVGLAFIAGGIAWMIMSNKRFPLICVVVGVAVMIVGCSARFIPSGYVGIRTAYGQISEKPTRSGLNWHAPFIENIHLVNCKQQEKNYGDIQIWSETSERTEVYCQNVVVDYQINAEYASWIWINVEEWDHNLIKQTSVESGIKAATKQFNDTDVTDRAKIEVAAKECVQSALNTKYGNQIVNIVAVTIGNINFSDAYNEAIEKKAQAKLAAETAEYENKQSTQKAEADAEARRIKAQGEADAIAIKAEAEAEANAKIAESLTPELIEKMKIDKWNGEVPAVSGSDAMIVDVGDVMKAKDSQQ